MIPPPTLSTRPTPRPRRRGAGAGPGLAVLAATVSASIWANPAWTQPVGPRIEFSAARAEVQEDQTDAFVSVRLVDCAARTPVGAVDARVLAVSGTAEEGIDFFAFGHVSLGASSNGPSGGQIAGRVFRSADVPIEIVHDDLDEPAEEFTLRLELAPGAVLDCGDGPRAVGVGPPMTVRIVDVPRDLSLVSFASTEVNVTEGDGADVRRARFVVTRSQGRMPVSVVCQTTRSGTATEREDFEPVASVLGWAEGDVEDKICEVPVLPDDQPENRETVALALVPLVGKLEIGVGKATLYLNDDDAPGRVQFTSVRYQAREGDRQAVIAVERRGGSEGGYSVRVRLTPRSARPGEDYQPVDALLSWAAGEEGVRELVLPLVDDHVPEGEESVLLQLEAASPQTLLGDLRDAMLFIADDDAATTTAVSSSAHGGGPRSR